MTPWRIIHGVPRDPFLAERARQLRRVSNEAETRLWSKLRGHQLAGFKFRRQHVLGTCIVDFVCLPAGLVVEVDGDTHGSDEAEACDAKRTLTLERFGYNVIRFRNGEVMSNLDQVLETIMDHLPERPSP